MDQTEMTSFPVIDWHCSTSASSAQEADPRLSKRMRQGTGEERIVAKPKPTLNLVSRFAASSPLALSSSASTRQEIFRATQSAGLESQSTMCRETCRWRFKSK